MVPIATNGAIIATGTFDANGDPLAAMVVLQWWYSNGNNGTIGVNGYNGDNDDPSVTKWQRWHH
jgi:hypothetical protein